MLKDLVSKQRKTELDNEVCGLDSFQGMYFRTFSPDNIVSLGAIMIKGL